MSTSHPGTNLCVLTGALARPPELRTLPSGAVVASLEVRVAAPEGPVEVVPVALVDPSPAVVALAPGTDVLVLGRVRRRFFRVGGTTQSRTEVVAAEIVPSRQRARARRVVAAAVAQLEAR
jgi:single-strand DNA-binding protein